jgi:hypothetical protein
MNRQEFEALRDLPDKLIFDDIVFVPSTKISTTLILEPIKVHNTLGYDVVLHGSYIPDIPTIRFNFSIVSEGGAICRIEVNSTNHGNAGRTHKHSLQQDSCPRKNIPSAVARPDLDLDTQTPRDIWETICREANIQHEGEFIEPK